MLSKADLVISHAGYATVMQMLKFSKSKPLLVPRLKKYKEHVNDHQKYFADYMRRLGLVKTINESNYLEKIGLDNRQNKILVKKYLESLDVRKNSLINYLTQVTEKYDN